MAVSCPLLPHAGAGGEAAQSGRVRLNGVRVEKPGHVVKPGDVLTLARGREVVVVRVLGCGERRGPASEAQALYEVVE